MERFFGGSPAAVILQLAIASIVIGVVLSFFGFNPANLYDAVLRLWDWISSLGLDAVKKVVRYMVLGAIIVVPLWLLSRIFSYFGPSRRQK
jgi:uncharacterized oligopeptide transporter (OPT) family protein